MRKQPGVIVLKGKSLILDGIDLIVDMRELSRSQTACSCASGANLTLRDCSITILNHAAGTYRSSSIRAEAAALRTPRLVRLESCLVRGALTDCFRLSGGPCEVVLRDRSSSPEAARWYGRTERTRHGQPDFRGSEPGGGAGADHRIDRKVRRRPEQAAWSIRAFGSVFGRLHGSGIASVICL